MFKKYKYKKSWDNVFINGYVVITVFNKCFWALVYDGKKDN